MVSEETKVKIWKAHYRDKNHDVLIDIINTEGEYSSDPLSFTFDGITFKGSTIADFQVSADDAEKASEKFSIMKAGGFSLGDSEVPYWYTLQRYSLDAEIPVVVVRRSDNCVLQGMIRVSFGYVEHDQSKIQGRYYCDDERVYHDDAIVDEFSLSVDGKKFDSSLKTLYFESALTDLQKQISPEYYLKCCFTCQYSDYSPYGCDDYGCMLCYRKQKESYLKVNTKDEYFEYLTDDYEVRQETFLCDEYEPRTRCGGYRGYVDGVIKE